MENLPKTSCLKMEKHYRFWFFRTTDLKFAYFYTLVNFAVMDQSYLVFGSWFWLGNPQAGIIVPKLVNSDVEKIKMLRHTDPRCELPPSLNSRLPGYLPKFLLYNPQSDNWAISSEKLPLAELLLGFHCCILACLGRAQLQLPFFLISITFKLCTI